MARNPKIDGTDLYAFQSYETGRTCPIAGSNAPCGYVTILANYQPIEAAAGGPNFFLMDPNAVYEIEIDNTGSGVESLTFQFRFQDTLANATLTSGAPTLPFAYVGGTNPAGGVIAGAHGFGAISSTGGGVENVTETYTMSVVQGPRRVGTPMPITNLSGSGGTTFPKPVDNVGANTVGNGAGQFGANYATYAATFVNNFDLPTSICNPGNSVPAGTHSRVFVGQRAEGFAVNLGGVFDTVNFTAGATAGHANVIGAQDQNFNDVANKVNVTTIAIEVPAVCLANAATQSFGVWTTSAIPQARVINPTPTFDKPDREGGPLVEVSRLGMPLVNEVIIGLDQKDFWNSSEPVNDLTNFGTFITDPTLPQVLGVLFGGAGVRAPANAGRADLVAIFATGIPGLNQIGSASNTPAEMLRLNVNPGGTNVIPLGPTAQNSPLGILGCLDNPTGSAGAKIDLANSDCDPFGFPNGRRPGDDVTDITLRAAMGGLVDTTDAPTGGCLHLSGATSGSGVVIGPGGPGVSCLPYGDGAANNQTNPLATGTIGLHGTGTATTNFLGGTTVVFPYLQTPLAGGAN